MMHSKSDSDSSEVTLVDDDEVNLAKQKEPDGTILLTNG